MPQVRPGLEVLLEERFDLIRGSRVGLLANQASVDRRLHHAVDLLRTRSDAQLVALFGPEHGLRGEAQDMESVDSGIDPATGLPVHSLYGSTAQTFGPDREMLEGIDVLVCDLQDVGARYYTFSATILEVLAAAAEASVAVVVTDRPNPLGGEILEGPILERGFESFVGRLPVPVRHGMTLGELARMGRNTAGLDVELHVVPAAGWHRTLTWSGTGLPWVPPSPNMPALETAVVYPGACLVEGTELSEGRGTTRPFEVVGAPWLDGPRLAAEMNGMELPGVRFRAHWFRPLAQKYAGRTCAGVQVHVHDSSTFRSFRTYVALLAAARRQAPERFAWRIEPYEFETRHPAIDLLAGSGQLRADIEAERPLAEMEAEWSTAADRFREARRPYLLYE